MDFCCVPHQLTDDLKKEKEKEPEKSEKQEITSYKKKFLEEKKDSDDSDEVTCPCTRSARVYSGIFRILIVYENISTSFCSHRKSNRMCRNSLRRSWEGWTGWLSLSSNRFHTQYSLLHTPIRIEIRGDRAFSVVRIYDLRSLVNVSSRSLAGGASGRGGDARRDGAGAQAAGAPEGHKEHCTRATPLVLQEEVPAGEEGYRETALRAARVHQTHRHPGDERSPAGEGEPLMFIYNIIWKSFLSSWCI